MKNNILVIVPSRQNPSGARRLLKSFKQTSTRGSDLIMFIEGEGYDAAPYLIGYEGKYGKSTIDLAKRYSNDHDYFMLAHDDMVFYTPGWDQKIMEVFDTVGDHVIACGKYGIAPTIPRGMLNRVGLRAMDALDDVYAVWRFFEDLPMSLHTAADFGIDAGWRHEKVTAVETDWLQADGDTLKQEVYDYAASLRRQWYTALPR